ncbi:MAG: hypothetical protein HY013_13655 [Candidatus Solibacter usitatus]|nr:hypothetical protein [Candidatus Solibacter usitatus]
MRNGRALLLVLSAATAAVGQTLEGSWNGTLSAGGASLRLALSISRSAEGTFSGILDSLDQGSTIPIDTITITGDSVRLELKRINGVYEGTLNADRSEITGTWTQGGPKLPLVFKRGPAPPPAKPPGPPPRPLDLPVEVSVPVPPAAFRAAGKTHLAYELHAAAEKRTMEMPLENEVVRFPL